MEKILLDNALESWSIAVKYCNDIKDGLATLHYQKTFVSSLHNAIELFLKQIMLDSNNHSVARMFKVKDEADANLQLKYFQSNDLNEFFSSLPNEERNKFYSIEFSELINGSTALIKNTLNELNVNSIKEELTLLQELRNNETHFYISKSDYLSEEKYVKLHNLMIIMYEMIKDYNLLPYWGEASHEYKHLEFKSNKINSFSYLNVLRSSRISQSVIEILNGRQLMCFDDAPYNLAEMYFEENETSDFSFNDVLAIITMMKQYGCISLTSLELFDEIDLGDGKIFPPQIVDIINITL